MADYNEQFGYTPNPACLDQSLNEVGTQDNHALSFEATDSIEPSCDERKNGFGCLTTNFIKKFNWLANAWEKAIHTLGLTDADLQDQINNISSVTIGLDNQIPYVNGTNDDFEYNTVLFYDHTQTQLNTEQITTNLGVITSEEFGAGANTNGFGDSVAVGNNAVTSARNTTAVGQNSVALGSRSTAYGNDADANGNDSVSMGQSSSAGLLATSIGRNSNSLNASFAGGASSDASGNSSIAVGFAASAQTDRSQAWGRGSVAGVYTPAECVIGSADSNGDIDYFYLGHGVEKDSLPDDVYVRATGGLGDDKQGFNMHLQGGASTGSGDGGTLFLGTAQAGAAGSARRVPVDMWAVNPDGNFESLINGAGIVLKSPDGLITRTLTIDNTGALIVA